MKMQKELEANEPVAQKDDRASIDKEGGEVSEFSLSQTYLPEMGLQSVIDL